MDNGLAPSFGVARPDNIFTEGRIRTEQNAEGLNLSGSPEIRITRRRKTSKENTSLDSVYQSVDRLD